MPLCREFEDVPQFVHPRVEAEVQEKLLPGSGVSPKFIFNIPQDWGIKGVEDDTSEVPEGHGQA